MSTVDIEKPWEQLATLIEEEKPEQVQEFLEALPSSEIALTMSRLSETEQTQVLNVLAPEEAADLVYQLPDIQAVTLVERLEPEAAAAILRELPSNEQADIFDDLPQPNAQAILDQMEPGEASDLLSLSRYPDDVAGGLMVTELLRFHEDQTIADVVEDLRSHADQYRDYDIQYAYVCDSAGKLTGVLRLRDLLLAKSKQSLKEIMIPDPLSVSENAPLEELADFFDAHDFLGVPVVNEQGELIGVVHKSAVDEAWQQRNDTDFLKVQGIVSEEIRSLPLLVRSRRRLSWLSVNILLNIMAASIIALFTETLEQVIALAVFLPIISDMSGCSGNQAVAVSMRELSLGLIRPTELFQVWMKEIFVGLVNGTALGILIGLVAILWQGNSYLGVVVGVALCLNTIVAVSIGGITPLLLKRMKIDPAVASGPLLTTITDMCGFFFVLGIASLLLSQLQS